ncbi:MAG: 30S ribosomal protein S17 [Nanoarchaeota archaeon]
MEKTRKTKHEETKEISCADKFCPIHGSQKLKLRGRTFEGNVIRKFHRRVTIQFERTMYIRKYERYEKRKTKLHARLPDCLKDQIEIGDYIKISECRPLSKIVNFIVIKKIRGIKNESS